MQLERLAWRCSAAVALTLLAACAPGDEDAAGAEETAIVRPVKVATVSAGETQIVRTYSATVLPAQEVALSFRVSGRIIELPIRSGKRVEEGEVIARLDPRDFEAEIARTESQLRQAEAQMRALRTGARSEDVASLQASVDAAQAEVDAAQAQVDRTTTLFERDVVAQAQVDRDVSTLRVAEARLEAARQELNKGTVGAREEEIAAQEAVIAGLQSNLQSLRDNLDDATLRAPFDGMIATRDVENFTNVRANEPIATLQALATPNLVFAVPAPDVPVFAAAEDLQLSVVLDGFPGRAFEAERSEFSTQADSATQTYQGRVAIENPDADPILSGMTGELTVSAETGGTPAPTVPLSAVVSGPDGSPFVWMLGEENALRPQPVALGDVAGRLVAVSEGLAVGDVVAVAGLSSLREGMVVEPITAVGG